jgi:hypothetical protein
MNFPSEKNGGLGMGIDPIRDKTRKYLNESDSEKLPFVS